MTSSSHNTVIGKYYKRYRVTGFLDFLKFIYHEILDDVDIHYRDG